MQLNFIDEINLNAVGAYRNLCYLYILDLFSSYREKQTT